MSTTKTKPLTKALLAGIMDDAVISRGRATDFNASMASGVYSCYQAENGPEKDLWGVLIHAKVLENICAQLFLTNTGRLYFRVLWDRWDGWIRVTTS